MEGAFDGGNAWREATVEREPRTERGRRTRRALLDAAAIEFGERGFHESSIVGITQRAGVALGSFYTYFESKEAVFARLSPICRPVSAKSAPPPSKDWRIR